MPRTLRILLVSRQLDISGTTAYTVGLAAQLARSNHRVALVAAGGPRVADLRAKQVTVWERPALGSAWRTYRSEDVLFVGVDIQDAEEDAAEYVRDLGITYPNGLDRDGRITIDYGVIGLPVTFFVNRDGIIQRRWVGAIDGRRLTDFVEELVAGTGPSDDGAGGNLEGYVELD